MLLPDDLIIKKNCSKAMISIHKKKKVFCNGKYESSKKTVNRWGIYMKEKNIDKKTFILKML